MRSISQEALKQQFSKMAGAGGIDVPESSSSTPTLLPQENVENFSLGDTKPVYFHDKSKGYLEGFSRYFENFL